MRRILCAMSLLTAAGMLNAAALGQSQTQAGSSERQGQQQEGSSGQQQQGVQAPDGFILIEEHVVMLTANEPQNHFVRAAQYLKANDDRAAAGEIRIAAGYLDMQASRGKKQSGEQTRNQGVPDLKSAADELRKAADQLQQQQGQGAGQDNQQQLSKAFAKANLALAQHFQSQAKREVDSKKAIMAGHDLDAAAAALRAAVIWSGQQPDQQTLTAVTQAQRTAMQLLSPDGQAQAQPQDRVADQTARTGDQTDQAQPAGARLPSSQTQAQDKNEGRIPEDASKTVEQLASAIQQCAQSISQSGDGKSAKPGQDEQRKQE